jgi:hypothetical protein
MAPLAAFDSAPQQAIIQDATPASEATTADIAVPQPLQQAPFQRMSPPSPAASQAAPQARIDPEQLEQAVEDEIRRRKADRIGKAITKWEDKVWSAMGDHLGVLLADGEIVTEEADEIEYLIQEEMERVFELKSLSAAQEMTPEEGKAEYALIREATDQALIVILGEQATSELRGVLDSK